MSKWINKIFGWIPCEEKIPEAGKTVRIKYKKFEGVGYISPFNGLWQNLAANAMTINFNRGIMVEYWKENKF